MKRAYQKIWGVGVGSIRERLKKITRALPLTSFEYQKKKFYGTQISEAEIPDFDYVLVKPLDMSLGRSVEVVVRVSVVFYLLLLLSQVFYISVL